MYDIILRAVGFWHLVYNTSIMNTTISISRFNSSQLAFKELFVGTLIYVCVLGLFSEYTSIVYAKSFSYILAAALVLEVLTYLTLMAKKVVVSRFEKARGIGHNTLVIFGAWLILFLSKFVFIGVIDLIFAGTVTIYGFMNIFVVVLIVTAAHKLADYVFQRLGTQKNRG